MIESKKTEKGPKKDIIARKTKIFDDIATKEFNGKRTSTELQKCYANIRSAYITKKRFNSATGLGTSDVKPLLAHEEILEKLICVACPVDNVNDSSNEFQVSFLKDSQDESFIRAPKREKLMRFEQQAISSSRKKEIEKSHLNSLKCLNELSTIDGMEDVKEFHKNNISATLELMIEEDI